MRVGTRIALAERLGTGDREGFEFDYRTFERSPEFYERGSRWVGGSVTVQER